MSFKQAPPDHYAEHKADGLMKIRAFHQRAGFNVVQYSPSESREVLMDAKREFDRTNDISTSTIKLMEFAGYQPEKVLRLWRLRRLMVAAEVDMDGIDNHPDTPKE